MVKIEKVDAGAKATFLREGVTTPVYTGMLLNLSELEAMEVAGGNVTVSIDETEIRVIAPRINVAPQQVTLVSEVKTQDEPVVIKLDVAETTVAEPKPAPAKVIVQPVRKK